MCIRRSSFVPASYLFQDASSMCLHALGGACKNIYVVERVAYCDLAKVEVAGSNPVSRSNVFPATKASIICCKLFISHTLRGSKIFGFKQQQDREMEQYLRVKRGTQQSFIDCGATLSHHHAVGTEHLPWLAADISPLGVRAAAAIQAQ